MPPDWIIEIVSPSDPKHDYVDKLKLYLDAGVREYWIVNPMNKSVIVYHLDAEPFAMESHTFSDTVKAGIYDDFLIDFSEIDRLLADTEA